MIYSIFFGIQRTCEETLGTVWVIFVLLNFSPISKRAATQAPAHNQSGSWTYDEMTFVSHHISCSQTEWKKKSLAA